jgi:hypothetical protein
MSGLWVYSAASSVHTVVDSGIFRIGNSLVTLS